jgi:hypothetical protein
MNIRKLFARRDLQIPSDLAQRRSLIEELSSMTADLKAPGTRHDDMALSLSLAAWPLRQRNQIGEQPLRLL